MEPGILKAIIETQEIFANNIFPQMKTNWQVRPDNIGHLIWQVVSGVTTTDM